MVELKRRIIILGLLLICLMATPIGADRIDDLELSKSGLEESRAGLTKAYSDLEIINQLWVELVELENNENGLISSQNELLDRYGVESAGSQIDDKGTVEVNKNLGRLSAYNNDKVLKSFVGGGFFFIIGLWLAVIVYPLFHKFSNLFGEG